MNSGKNNQVQLSEPTIVALLLLCVIVVVDIGLASVSHLRAVRNTRLDDPVSFAA